MALISKLIYAKRRRPNTILLKLSRFRMWAHKWSIVIDAVVTLIFASLALTVTLLVFRPVQAKTMFMPTDNSTIWPLSGSAVPDDSILSPFGPRWQASQGRYDYHPGIDIAAPPKTPVHVITDGLVSKVGWLSPDAGLTVIVYHPNLDLYSAYLHLNATSVVVDQVVTQGQVIGLVGNSGTTDLYHLHFEIRLTANNYPDSTRNPMGYLPRPDITTPTIRIHTLQSDPIYSPTMSLLITTTRAELDLNQVRVTLLDRATATIIDEQFVDFNQRLHTGADTLNQDGIQLTPAPFNSSTIQYALTATFYTLYGLDSFTLTAQAIDLAGHATTATITAADTTPPGKVTSLNAWRRDGSVSLWWIAPGDSDYVGQAMAYEVRYADEPINNFTWNSATILPNPPVPAAPGLFQTWTIRGPLPDPVCFALLTRDDEGNVSLLSNSPCALQITFLPIILKRL